jgi:predicted nuclease of restriction endonuclease-like (RecB) superfamily
MRKFYETYRDDEKVAPLVRQLPLTHNLIILGQSKRPEEREFYLRMAIREQWSKRELERQFKAGLFERSVLNPVKLSPTVTHSHPVAADVFRDSYVLEFLDLPDRHTEADLQRALLQQLKDFLIEPGRDFCFVGSEYLVQVGGRDFALDLLFFHRGLNCLVAVELKVGRFEPEYLGKLNFYLEALDRDERKSHENPSIGVLLCASKDDEVVEYALNRSLSPALIAEYQTQLPDKALLQAKLHEFYSLNMTEEKDQSISVPMCEADNRTRLRSLKHRLQPNKYQLKCAPVKIRTRIKDTASSITRNHIDFTLPTLPHQPSRRDQMADIQITRIASLHAETYRPQPDRAPNSAR